MKPRAGPARPRRLFHFPAPTTMFEPHSPVLPLELPRLSDKAAAQLIELLHQILAGIEYHYADQAHRYRKRQQQTTYTWRASPSKPTDPPF